MPLSSFDNKKPHHDQKFQMESFPVYFVPAKNAPKQSRLRTIVSAHKFVFSSLLIGLLAAAFYLWKTSGFSGLTFLVQWIHEIAAGVLLVATISLWGSFYQRDKARKAMHLSRNPRMELTAISSKVVLMSPHHIDETPVYIASESLSIDYWVSRKTMAIDDEDLAIGDLPDEYIAPDALVLSLRERKKN